MWHVSYRNGVAFWELLYSVYLTVTLPLHAASLRGWGALMGILKLG